MEKQKALWSMVKILKKSITIAKSYEKRLYSQLSEITLERERLEVQWEKERSDVIKKAIEQKTRIEEMVKKTYIEAQS
jgi:hypothetical protein